MADNLLKGLLGAASDDQFRSDLKNGLFDLGKGASRAAGQMVTGGVDLISLLLSPLGYNHHAPVGSTVWAEQKGMIPKAEYTNRLAGLLGEGLGGISPMVAQAKAPQIAKGLLTIGENATKPNLLNTPSRNQAGAIVWHGSPHTFDKFDSRKIGTGEGAQAYGHGIYMADSPGVAKSYAEQLSTASGPTGDVAKYWRANGGESAYRDFAKNAGLSNQEIEQVSNAIKSSGYIYKVDLPDKHISKMLDWDKPLSQQTPEVQKFAEQVYRNDIATATKPGDGLFFSNVPDVPMSTAEFLSEKFGRDLYSRLEQAARDGVGNPSLASLQMQQAGIPGIRYLDGVSRGTGSGSSNFVVFPGNENILKIIERNGQPVNALHGLLGR